MATFAEIKTAADSPTQVRKQLEIVAFLAPEDAPVVESLTDAQGALQPIPEEYSPVGLISPDGITWGADTNVEDVEALGYATPVRRDITSVTRTVAFTALEAYRRPLLELAYGIDLSAVEQGANGEIVFDHPDRPIQRFYRFLAIGHDGSGTGEYFRAKFLPRVSISEFPEEVWSATDPTQYPITLSTFVDDVVGTGQREFIAGPGAKAAATVLGFTQAAAG